MKALSKKLLTAFAAVSVTLSPAAAYAQDTQAAPVEKTEKAPEGQSGTPLSPEHQKIQKEAKALLPQLENISFLCHELYSITKMVSETPQITDHPKFKDAYNYAATICQKSLQDFQNPKPLAKTVLASHSR